MAKTETPTPARRAVGLLDDPDFQAAAKAFRKPSSASGTPEEVRQATAPGGALDQARQRAVDAFKSKWGVTPPHALLLDATAPRAEAEAVLAGRLGLIAVRPWTTEDDVVREFKRHRAAIRREARMGEEARLDGLAAWLMDNGCSATDIARHLFGRRDGLRRRTRAEVDRSDRLLNEVDQRVGNLRAKAGGRFASTGAWNAAQARAYAAVRGKEPRAGASVRVRVKRHRQKADRYTARHVPADHLSAAVVELLRAYTLLPPKAVGPLARLIDEIRRALLTPAPRNTK